MQNNRKNKIIEFFLKNVTGGSSAVFSYLLSENIKASLVTVKRDLSELVSLGILEKQEKGPETSYELSIRGRIESQVNAREYCSIQPDKRYGRNGYDFSIFEHIDFGLFSETELKQLHDSTVPFRKKATDVSDVLIKKELERFIIELSWKSSRIEGNTYNILDTERLIREGIEAFGHSKDEAVMILNHKTAFDFAHSNRDLFKTLNKSNVEKIHSLIVSGLPVKIGYRHTMVGITGSKYKPLDNEHQIREAMENLFSAINRIDDPYSKALLALAGISYIQAFEDGNKRTSRMIANAVLLSHGLAPLSYRSVDEQSYRDAMLVFYELNSLASLKNIFTAQYVFATDNYLIK